MPLKHCVENASWRIETPLLSFENEKSQSRSGIDPSVEKMGFWEWSQSPQYAVKRLIPQNTGTYPRTAFYELGINCRTSNSFVWDLMVKELPYFGIGPRASFLILGLVPEGTSHFNLQNAHFCLKMIFRPCYFFSLLGRKVWKIPYFFLTPLW